MKKLSKIFTFLIFLFMYAPIMVMVFFSFNSSKSTFVFEGFSTRWYSELFGSSQIANALRNTLILAILSAVIATVLGTIASLGIYRIKSKAAKKTIMGVTNIPMMNPDVVTGISLMLLFVFVGRFIGSVNSLSFYTILIAHITFNLPYVILNVLPKLSYTSGSLLEASEDLGCTPVQSFFRVILPNIKSGILSGFIMAFTLSLDDFVISYFTTGTGFQTLPLLIYSKTKKTVKPDMFALSSLIFVVILLLLILVFFLQSRADSIVVKTKTTKQRVMRIVGIIVCVAVTVSIILFIVGTPNGSLKAVVDDEANIGVKNQEQYKELFSSLESEYTAELSGTTLNVFNWGEYISDGSDDSLDVVDAFASLTGINVVYDNFESNETMYSKLASGAVSYDIVIPSDYMIGRLNDEKMLRKLDFSQIENYKYIDDEYKNLYFDENNEYSIPYNVGMVGLVYNTKIVTDTVDSWSIMWDEKYKDNILTFNNSRDAFAIAQFMLGQDVNTTQKADWDSAAGLLKKQNSILQARVMDEVFNKMEGGNAAIAPYYAGDCLTMMDNNEDLAFVYPKEGVNIFVDSMCVPSNCQNYKAAMMFLNFMLEPEIGLANAEYVCYASPNTAVKNNPEYTYYQNEVLYPSEENKPKSQYFHSLDDKTREYFENLWEDVKRSK